ncbi:penicillin-binding protein 2 [Limibacter armeniacum]|uniref:penicillin-binding protein 2 n=1 Tax=Limibacter armeniacum TaxID=466084 RepID=UPI002FE69F5D
MAERKWYIVGGFTLIFILYAVILLNIQVFSSDYKRQANANMVDRIVEYPLRGMIYDRDGRILVNNAPVFDVMVTPKQLHLNEEDTVLLCQLFEMERVEFRDRLQKIAADKYSWYKPNLFLKQLTKMEYAKIQDQLIRYKGFEVVPKTIREYPHTSLANALGYIKEVSKSFLDKDTTEYYGQGDLIGKVGVEYFYEKELRGKRGVSYVMKNVKGQTKGKFRSGEFDTLPEVGMDLVSSIDLELQQYAELLMQNKRGAVVAIEPSTGEILTMLSAPSYDPNLLTGEGRRVSRNYVKLNDDPDKPLFNRAMQSRYPPGSTFKTVMSLIGMQEGVLDTTYTRFPCAGEPVKCHDHPSPLSIAGAVQNSCNPWYYKAIRKIMLQHKDPDPNKDLKMNMDHWQKMVKEFGLGRKLGIDLPYEKGGLIPNAAYYDRAYNGRQWKISNVYSISIGQGEILAMPIQLANLAATIANRGYYYTPHIIKDIGGAGPKEQYSEKNVVNIKRDYFDYVARAMSGVKTARLAMIPDIAICGKTGTAQNPHGKDHSIFMAFAPLDKPKIAIAVYVENAGFGGTWAAPIASLIMEKYIRGEISEPRKWIEKRMLEADLMEKKETPKVAKAH